MRHIARSIAILVTLLAFSLPSPASGEILRTLRYGSQGSDVRELQQILNRDPTTRVAASGPGSPGNETTYFGSLTLGAVKRFQQKYWQDILAPIGLVSPTGIVGSQTRLFLLRLAQGAHPPPAPSTGSRVPVITSISPSVVTASTVELVIRGLNFSPSDNTVMISSEPPNAFMNLLSPDGATLRITFHFFPLDRLEKELEPYRTSPKFASILEAFIGNIQTPDGKPTGGKLDVRMLVRNSGGDSRVQHFTVDVGTILRNNFR